MHARRRGGRCWHRRLSREITAKTGAAVVFPNYSRAPEARYPVAIEESYAVLRWLAEHGAEKDLDGSRIAVAGDSVGGNMAAALAILASSAPARGSRHRCCSTRSPMRAST